MPPSIDSAPEDNDPLPPDLTTMHVRRAAAGDGHSLEWVIRRLSPLLLSGARYRLGPGRPGEVDPEDLVQDAWLVAMPRLAELLPRGGRLTPVLLRFLSTTILHQVRNILRQRARQGPPATGPGPGNEPQADESGVVSRAVRREIHSEVELALAQLTSEEREVILLRGVEQHSNTAVGTMLHCSAEAVSKRYQRALARIRGLLPQSVFDELPD